MPAQHQAAKPAFQADDMLVLHRSPDRHRRCQHFRQGRRRVSPEATERAVYRCNQPRELIDTDTALRDITTDDLGDQAGSTFCALLSSAISSVPDVVDYGLCSRAWFVCVNLFGPSRDPLKPKDRAWRKIQVELQISSSFATPNCPTV